MFIVLLVKHAVTHRANTFSANHT